MTVGLCGANTKCINAAINRFSLLDIDVSALVWMLCIWRSFWLPSAPALMSNDARRKAADIREGWLRLLKAELGDGETAPGFVWAWEAVEGREENPDSDC